MWFSSPWFLKLVASSEQQSRTNVLQQSIFVRIVTLKAYSDLLASTVFDHSIPLGLLIPTTSNFEKFWAFIQRCPEQRSAWLGAVPDCLLLCLCVLRKKDINYYNLNTNSCVYYYYCMNSDQLRFFYGLFSTIDLYGQFL